MLLSLPSLCPTVPQTSTDGHLENVFSDQRHGFVSHWAKTHVHPAGLPGHPGQTAPKGNDQCLLKKQRHKVTRVLMSRGHSVFLNNIRWNNDHYCALNCVNLLSLSDTNWPDTVSRPGERAGDVCLSQLFVAAATAGTLTWVHTQHSHSVFRQRREISFVDALFLFVTVEHMKLQCLTQIKSSLHFRRVRWWVLLLFMYWPPQLIVIPIQIFEDEPLWWMF